MNKFDKLCDSIVTEAIKTLNQWMIEFVKKKILVNTVFGKDVKIKKIKTHAKGEIAVEGTLTNVILGKNMNTRRIGDIDFRIVDYDGVQELEARVVGSRVGWASKEFSGGGGNPYRISEAWDELMWVVY